MDFDSIYAHIGEEKNDSALGAYKKYTPKYVNIWTHTGFVQGLIWTK